MQSVTNDWFGFEIPLRASVMDLLREMLHSTYYNIRLVKKRSMVPTPREYENTVNRSGGRERTLPVQPRTT